MTDIDNEKQKLLEQLRLTVFNQSQKVRVLMTRCSNVAMLCDPQAVMFQISI
jgi:hypothetical protein